MILNQQTGVRHSLWGWLAGSNLLLLGAMEWADGATGWAGLSPSANMTPYLIGVFATFLYLSPLVRAYAAKLVHGGLFDPIMVGGRITLSVAVALMLIYFLLKDTATSRAFLTYFVAASLFLNVASLIFIPPLCFRYFFNGGRPVRAVVAGDGPMPVALRAYLDRCRRYGIEFVGFYGERPSEGAGLPRRGNLDGVHDLPDSGPEAVDQVLFFGDELSGPRMRGLVRACLAKGCRVQAYAGFTNFFDEPVKLTSDGELNFLTFVDEPLLNPINNWIKRCIDIAIALPVVVFILPPLCGLVWAAHRLQSPGPLFFRQKRHGRGRDVFEILKFRSMHVRPPGDEARQASAADERVFRFGRFLRRTSLDEFPQFINVLRGDMSVVGPRPHLTAHDDAFEKHIHVYRSRHFVKPGITGYAQIHGLRGEIAAPAQIVERVRKDIYYVTHWTPRLELWIVLKTIHQVLFPPRSAY